MDDMDKFGEKQLTKKITFAKKTWYDWYDWLINYIPEPMITENQNVSRNNLKTT